MKTDDKSFDKKTYDKNYIKENYKALTFRYKKDDIDYIKDFAKQRELSIPQAILKAFRYIDENDVEL